ncbi:MAG TPA: choice-of-anchor X domain-containing protein [Pyrinomonadaceae bacterium]|nr:choice-of-anchor X domain-containing protein [Pyrinomonadaceae bacterium]
MKAIYKHLSAVISLLLISSSLSPALAQRKRGNTSAPANQQVARLPAEGPVQTCDIWTGKIEVTRRRTEARTEVTRKGEHPTDQHNSGTNEYRSSFDYKAAFDINDSSGSTYEDGSTIISLKGAVSAEAAYVVEEKDSWKTETDCFPDTPRIRTAGKNSSSTITESGSLARTRDDGGLSIKGNRFKISFGVPGFGGKRVDKQSVKFFGWCMPEANPPHDSTDEGEATFSADNFEIVGTLDPKNPNVITGSSQPDAETTVVWNLARRQGECDGKLKITELMLAHHVFPNKTAWEEVEKKTVDGNEVRITAKVANESKKPRSGTVVFKEVKSGQALGEKSVSVPAESEAEVELLWDTSGFAWTDAGKPESNREVEASVSGDSQTAEITIVPKPVILAHGLWSNGAAWSDYHNYLEEAHTYAWKAYAVGADPKVATMNTGKSFGNMEPTFSIERNAQELGKQINHAQKAENAWHVDLVAHSMGGLISRYYIHQTMTDAPDGKPTITHLVMLGTPNMGSPCADVMYPGYKALGFEVEALRQLQTSVVADFNGRITNRKGVKFSILAGVPVLRTCQKKAWGDGVVEIPSALWRVADRDFAPRVHTDITGREDFFAFVKPRLAVGPKKAKEQAAMRSEGDGGEFFAHAAAPEQEILIASLNPRELLAQLLVRQAADPSTRVESSQAVKIAAGASAEVEVNLAPNAGVTFVAPPSVGVSLVNADGEIEQTIEAGSAEAAQSFKTFYADKAGKKTLRFVNSGGAPAGVVVVVWTDTNRLALELVEVLTQPDGSVKLQAKLTDDGAGVKGANVAVKIDGQGAETALLDDGKHGDGAADDGIYGATIHKLAAGGHLIEARATANGAAAVAGSFLVVSPK